MSLTGTMVTAREASLDDAAALARIFYDGFDSIAARHSFPREPASREFVSARVDWMLHHPRFHGLVAERDHAAVGCCFVDERSIVAGIGPVAVAPEEQDAGVGRLLMERALERERLAPGVRLVQTAYHYRSLALYAKLGFVVREPLSAVQGSPPRIVLTDRSVRAATTEDLPAANALALRVHGHDRGTELSDAIDDCTALVVEREDRISGYATGLGYGWHAVGETNADLTALLAAPERYLGLGVLVPSRNADLLRWCLDHGLRIVQQSTLMTLGLYCEPAGAWIPSILF